MSASPSGLSSKALGWALLSQVFWVPLLAIDLHDRWVAHQRLITPVGKPLPASPIARATPFSLNDLLGAAKPVQQLAGQANQAVSGALGSAVRGAASGVGVLLSSAGSSASSLLDRPFTVSVDSLSADSQSGADSSSRPSAAAGSAAGGAQAQSLHTLLGGAFTRAQLLGGSIGLGDLQEGPMATLALVEQAQQRSSGDPLAPLPSLWREPMRQALQKLPGAPLALSPARLVHLPSSRVSQSVEVPLALQSDGSVDILEPPSNPAVLREIEGWSRQQRLPATGSLQPAVVHLHPLPSPAPITPAPVSGLSAAGRGNRVSLPEFLPAAARPAAPPRASRSQAPAAAEAATTSVPSTGPLNSSANGASNRSSSGPVAAPLAVEMPVAATTTAAAYPVEPPPPLAPSLAPPASEATP